MTPLERLLRTEVDQASKAEHGPDESHHAIVRVLRRALTRVRAARGHAVSQTSTTLELRAGIDVDSASVDWASIDWASIDVDELADTYERLLGGARAGRKRSGTYYTPIALVERLLDEVLDPILDHACARPDPRASLIGLRICDPACGSGRFLLAAARRVAARLVAITHEDPATALATVLERCIYGVDVDPLALELCRLSWTIETHARATADQLRCGDALLGAGPQQSSSWAEADAWCLATVWPAHSPGAAASPDPRTGQALIRHYQFFHWSLAFPEVFAAGGFDLVIGNPPWEVLEQPGDAWSATRAGAQRLIAASGRFPRGAAARKSLYVLFAELGDDLCRPSGRLGMVLPTEIVQGAIAERIARPWFEQRRCAAVFDFQNRPPGAGSKPGRWFPGVHPQLRFSLVCLAPHSPAPALCADATSIAETRDPDRVYHHDAAAILELCPRSFRLPLLRGPLDRQIHARAHARGRPFAELLAEPGVVARLMFNFGPSERQAKRARPGPGWLRVYEGQHIHQFDHRHASGSASRTARVDPELRADPSFAIATATHLPQDLVEARLRALVGDGPLPEFLLVLRRQARAADAHVGIAAIIPRAATEGSLTCVIGPSGPWAALVCATFNSFAFNYLLRGRQTGPNLNRGLLAELPMIDPRVAEHARFNLDWVAERVVELCYTATELEPFARACGRSGPPSPWSAERRHQVRCELEAGLFHLYGFDLESAEHALDRFTIVARRETARFGEFRTKHGILTELAAIGGVSE